MPVGYKMHCILCGCKWGNGKDIGSSGICPKCFKEWINARRKAKQLKECYGEYGQHNDVNCETCPVAHLCFKDTYENE